MKARLLNSFMRQNYRPECVDHFDLSGEYPTVVLKNGIRLSSHAMRNLPSLKRLGIPAGGEEVALAYVLRFLYPHFMPQLTMRRRWYPLFPHRQHQNTIRELPLSERGRVADLFTVRPDDEVLEVGPYIGFGTIQMSRQARRVVSVEADRRALRCLAHNIEQNDLANVKILKYAIGSALRDNAEFWVGRGQANSVIQRRGAALDRVPMRRLSNAILDGKTKPTFLILTINGGELAALKACPEILHDTAPLRIITPGWYRDAQGRYGPRIINLLKKSGFRVWNTPGMNIFAYKGE